MGPFQNQLRVLKKVSKGFEFSELGKNGSRPVNPGIKARRGKPKRSEGSGRVAAERK